MRIHPGQEIYDLVLKVGPPPSPTTTLFGLSNIYNPLNLKVLKLQYVNEIIVSYTYGPYTVPTASLLHPYSIPTASLWRPYSVPMASLWCPYCVPTASLHQPLTVPIASLHRPYTVPTPSLHCPYTIPTPSLQSLQSPYTTYTIPTALGKIPLQNPCLESPNLSPFGWIQ